MRVCGQGDVVWPMTMWIWQRKWHRGRQLWQLLWMIKITIDCETSDQWHSILAAVVADGLRGYSDTSLCQFPLFTLFGYVSIVSLCQSARSCSTQRTPGGLKTEILKRKKYKHHLCQPELLKMTKNDKKFPFPDTAGACWLPSLEWLRVAPLPRDSSHALYYGYIHVDWVLKFFSGIFLLVMELFCGYIGG